MFFDTPVSRGWVSSLHTLPYTEHNDPNTDGNVYLSMFHIIQKLMLSHLNFVHSGHCLPEAQAEPYRGEEAS